MPGLANGMVAMTLSALSSLFLYMLTAKRSRDLRYSIAAASAMAAALTH